MNTRKYLWLIFGIIGALINLTNADSSYKDSQPLGMALSGFFLGAILGFILSLIIDSIGNSKKINESVSLYKEKKIFKENHKLFLVLILSAKHYRPSYRILAHYEIQLDILYYLNKIQKY